jgi:hypothetical protein
MTSPDLDPAQRVTAHSWARQIVSSGIDPASWLAALAEGLERFTELDQRRGWRGPATTRRRRDMAYENTSVSVERSQAEIRKLLAKHDSHRFGFGEERDELDKRWASVTFVHGAFQVRMRVPLKLVDELTVQAKARSARTRTADEIRDHMYEQEERRIWRVIAWNLKARMVAVEEGVETFEEAFLAHLLDPSTNRTFYEQLAEEGRVELPAPLLALPERT